MPASMKQAPRRIGGQSQWALAAMAGLAAMVGLMVAGNNAYLSTDPYFGNPERSTVVGPPSVNIMHALTEGRAPVPTVTLTPAVVRALLTMDEKDQMALVVDPTTPEEKTTQREVLCILLPHTRSTLYPRPPAHKSGAAFVVHSFSERYAALSTRTWKTLLDQKYTTYATHYICGILTKSPHLAIAKKKHRSLIDW